MNFDGAPVADWEGETLQAVLERLQRYQRGLASEARSEAEKEAFDAFPNPTADDADFMLHMMRQYDKGFRYWVDVANVGNRATLDLLLHEHTMPGFNDSGAHITNMAFFDGNLMSLKLAQQKSIETVATMVRRLNQQLESIPDRFGERHGPLSAGIVEFPSPDLVREETLARGPVASRIASLTRFAAARTALRQAREGGGGIRIAEIS